MGNNTCSCSTRARRTPAPWCNVIANPHFGTLVSESGSSYTWVHNSQRYRLTPWNNDPVSDPSGELIYVRDDDDGRLLVAHARARRLGERATWCVTRRATRASSTRRAGSGRS